MDLVNVVNVSLYTELISRCLKTTVTSKLHSQRGAEQIKVRECLLTFSLESFVFLVHI
jgi:hypothetical protein